VTDESRGVKGTKQKKKENK